MDVCSAVGVNLTTYLPAAASQDSFCPGYVTGDCKEVPGASLSTAYWVVSCATYVCMCDYKSQVWSPRWHSFDTCIHVSSMYPCTLCHKYPFSHLPPSLPTPLLSLLATSVLWPITFLNLRIRSPNSLRVHSWSRPLCKRMRTSDPQRNVMDQSTNSEWVGFYPDPLSLYLPFITSTYINVVTL